VRIADFEEVAAMIAKGDGAALGDGAGLVKAARELVKQDEVPRRMLLATLLVADAVRRSVANARADPMCSTLRSKLLRVLPATCPIVGADDEQDYFDSYISPLRDALTSMSPSSPLPLPPPQQPLPPLPPAEFWIKYGDIVTAITPRGNTIDSLKVAVMMTLESWHEGPVRLAKMQVTKHGSREAYTDMGAELEANTSRTPYTITLTDSEKRDLNKN
jgi:hypothetical protein